MNSFVWFAFAFALCACAKIALGDNEVGAAPVPVLIIATLLVAGGFFCLLKGWLKMFSELFERLRS